MDNLQPIPNLLRQLLDILPVLGREQDSLDTRPERPDQFLLDPAHGSDPPAQGYLALCTEWLVTNFFNLLEARTDVKRKFRGDTRDGIERKGD
jgi:hypothetical protein